MQLSVHFFHYFTSDRFNFLKDKMPLTYKLHYFKVRARGELARMVLAAAGQDYEDIRIDFQNWPNIKPTMPTGQMPMMEIDEQKLSQSMAIARYLAREFGFTGKTNMEQALVDQVVDTAGDIFNEVRKFYLENDETKKAEIKKTFFDETAPRMLGILTKFLEQNTGGDRFFVGNSLTIADMAVYDLLETLQKAESSVLAKFPKLEANRKLVATQPRIGEYLKKRPDSSL